MNFRRTAKNVETLEQIYGEKAENLPELVRKWKGAAIFWCVQGDAVARVGAEATVDSGGGAPEAKQHKEDDTKRHEGEKVKMTPQSYL